MTQDKETIYLITMIALESEAMPSNENDSLSICLNIGTKANNWMDDIVCIYEGTKAVDAVFCYYAGGQTKEEVDA